MQKAKKRIGVFLVAACLGTVSLAHGGVQNAAVMARMEAIKPIGEAMKVRGSMAKGVPEFDAETARAAAADVARFAEQTPALFKSPEDDLKTEALPAIWERFEDFTTKAQETEALARRLALSLATKADLGTGLTQLGASCKACHKEYRK